MEEVLGREEAEDLMGLVQGTVVLWPYDWYVSLVFKSMVVVKCEGGLLTCGAMIGLRGRNGVGIGCTISISWRRWRSTTEEGESQCQRVGRVLQGSCSYNLGLGSSSGLRACGMQAGFDRGRAAFERGVGGAFFPRWI